MNATDPHVDEYFQKLTRWREELAALRAVALASGLVEAWKWRAPCYTHDGKNVAILGAFKAFCSISFFKGALLKDPHGVLEKPGENTQAARLIKFTSARDIEAAASILDAYLHEAIEIERAGRKVATGAKNDPTLPAELLACFGETPALKAAFDGLTPGRRRAYVMHFTAPKQSKTRTARIEKCTPRILDGKGLNDCTCGLTKRPPGCDGSLNTLA